MKKKRADLFLRSDLLSRGWTATMIAKKLGNYDCETTDDEKYYWGYYYDRERVLAAEADDQVLANKTVWKALE